MKPEVGQSVDYSKLPPMEEGIYETIVKSYSKVENPYYHPVPYSSDKPVTRGRKVYQPGEVIPADPDYLAHQYQFVFEIAEGEHQGRWLFKRTGTMLTANERNHMYKLFSKIIDVDLLIALINDNDAPDIDEDIVGQPVQCVVEIVDGKKGPTNKVAGFFRSTRKPSEFESGDVDELDATMAAIGAEEIVS